MAQNAKELRPRRNAARWCILAVAAVLGACIVFRSAIYRAYYGDRLSPNGREVVFIKNNGLYFSHPGPIMFELGPDAAADSGKLLRAWWRSNDEVDVLVSDNAQIVLASKDAPVYRSVKLTFIRDHG